MLPADRVYQGPRHLMRLNDRIECLAGQIKELSIEVRDIDRRLIRVETTLELASTGWVRPRLPPLDDQLGRW